MPDSTGTSTTPTNATTMTDSPAHSATTPTGASVTIEEALRNLAGKMVKQAIMDAHPHSPIPQEIRGSRGKNAQRDWERERGEAEVWVRDFCKDRPNLLTYVLSLWRMKYIKAAIELADRRLTYIPGTEGQLRKAKKLRELAEIRKAEAFGDTYVDADAAAQIAGISPSTLRWWARHKGIPKSKRFKRGGVNFLGFDKESVREFAEQYNELDREQVGRDLGSKYKFKPIWYGRGFHRRTNG